MEIEKCGWWQLLPAHFRTLVSQENIDVSTEETALDRLWSVSLETPRPPHNTPVSSTSKTPALTPVPLNLPAAVDNAMTSLIDESSGETEQAGLDEVGLLMADAHNFIFDDLVPSQQQISQHENEEPGVFRSAATHAIVHTHNNNTDAIILDLDATARAPDYEQRLLQKYQQRLFNRKSSSFPSTHYLNSTKRHNDEVGDKDFELGDAADGDKSNVENSTGLAMTLGFSTAAGKKVEISEDALKQAKKLFGDEENLIMDSTEKKGLNGLGFSTAGGRKVMISDDALQKARTMFEDEEHIESNTIGNMGFSTAGGKKVTISEDALKKAKTLFGEQQNLDMNAEAGPGLNMGFSTAGGKKVTISEDALKNAKTLFGDEREVRSAVPSLGFSTAGGKKVTISKDALQQVKALFGDEELHGATNENLNLGFSTAAGGKVKLPSTTAMRSAKQMFVDEEPEDETIQMLKAMKRKSIERNEKEKRQKLEQEQSFHRSAAVMKPTTTATAASKKVLKAASNPAGATLRRQSNQRKKFKAPKRIIPVESVQENQPKNKVPLAPVQVFDLTVPQGRYDLKTAFPNGPRAISLEEIQYFGLTNDVLAISWDKARTFAFDEFSSVDTALNFMLDSGAKTDRRWVENHWALIVWKLASYTRSWPDSMQSWFTYHEVLRQLLYRYEMEVNQGKRSVLKAVCENDEASGRPMVLVVTDIGPEQQQGQFIGISDGWYRLKALVDPVLSNAARRGRLNVGDKLLVFGSHVMGQQEACMPLEMPADAYMTMNANSVKKVRWNERLGLKHIHPPRLSIRSISTHGGVVPCIDVIVMRRWPMAYTEILPDGSRITRNQAQEDEAERKFMEQVQNEMERTRSRPSTGRRSGLKRRSDISELETGKELFDAFQAEDLTPSFVENLSMAQREALQSYIDSGAEMQQQMESETPRRNVTGFFKISVCDYPNQEVKHPSKTCLITFWRPDPSTQDALREGRRLRIYNLTARPNSDRLMLSSTKQTIWKIMPTQVDMMERSMYVERRFYMCNELAGLNCGIDVDIVCRVVAFGKERPRSAMSELMIRDVYVCDESEALVVVQVLWNERAASIWLMNRTLILQNLRVIMYDPKFDIAITAANEDTIVSSSSKHAPERFQSIEYWCNDPDACLALTDKLSFLFSF